MRKTQKILIEMLDDIKMLMLTVLVVYFNILIIV